MLSRGGVGGGNIMGTIRHTFSPKLSGEVSTIGYGHSVQWLIPSSIIGIHYLVASSRSCRQAVLQPIIG